MKKKKERDSEIIKSFEKLLRSGKDYTVNYMYNEAGKVFFLSYKTVETIINNHYRDLITQDMKDFVVSLSCNSKEKVSRFSERFGLCKREAMLFIRYIK